MEKFSEGSGVDIAKKIFPDLDLYRVFFQNSSEILLLTASNLIADCNQSACSFWGIGSKNELIGKSLDDLIAETDDVGKTAGHLFTADGQTNQIVGWRVGETGEKIVFTKVSSTKIQLNNRNYHLLKLTKHHEPQQNSVPERKESENKYKRIFDSVPDLYYRTNLEGTILEVSPSISKYAYLIDEDIVGKSIEDYYYNLEDRSLLLNELKKTGEIFDYELILKAKNGRKIWTSINVHFLYDENNEVVGLEGWIRDISERKQNEEKLKQSVSVLQATLNSTTDGILVVGLNGQIVTYNEAFKKIFNLPEILLETGNDRTLLAEAIKMLKDPEEFLLKVEDLYIHPEQESYDTLEFNNGRLIERYSRPQWIDGQPVGRVWSFRDETERRNAEQQLNLMAHTLKSVNECISITDISDNILFINEAFSKTYGYSPEELIGKNISVVRSAQNDDLIINQILDKTSEEGWTGEINNRRKDGTIFPISLSTTVIKNEKGETLGLVGVAMDITDRKKAEEQLRQSEEKYRKLIESMPDGVYRSTHEGCFVEVNPAMVEILGYDSVDDLLAIDIKKQLYFDPSDRESLALQLHDKELDVFPLKKKDGSAVYVEDHGWYVKDSAGDIIYHEGIMRDVTERKIAEMQLQKYSQELRELNATKDKFFSIIAHDLKSPFSSITGLSEMLKNEARHLDISTIEQYAGIINYTSNNTYLLLENLLEWALVQQSRIEFRPGPIVVNQIVKDIFELMAEKVANKKIATSNLIPEKLIITGDENMIKTIFRNLISNALKFTPANGVITVSAELSDYQIEFSVKDSGMGISRENIEKLFNIGTTYTQRGTENEKGTGLGLLLCKEFVEKHGGKIRVESKLGSGSEFKFTLPA